MPYTCFSQNGEALYFFIGKDAGKGGIRTQSGKEIIPAEYKSLYYEEGKEIKDAQIYLIDNNLKPVDSMNYWYSIKAFNRKGEYLYTPYWVDNGIDDYVEGLRRFVNNGHMGFVDRQGNVIVPAIFNYVHPFYRGYAIAANECKYVKQRKTPLYYAPYKCGQHFIINRNMDVLYTFKETDTIQALTDSLITALQLPVKLNADESKVAKLLSQVADIQKYVMDAAELKVAIHAVVSEHPGSKNGYYLVDLRTDVALMSEHLSFLISEDGKQIRFLSPHGEEMSLETWRKEKGL